MTTHTPTRARTLVRRALAAGVLLFTLYALGRIQVNAPESFLLGVLASLGLVGVLAAIWRKS